MGLLIKVACILDNFSYTAFESDCNLIKLNIDSWKFSLLSEDPNFLFVESAWASPGDGWFNKISHCSPELLNVIKEFKRLGKPTFFWNKEDPIHFDRFLKAASNFDYVFTTDINCISKYKYHLGHGRVFLLPFACQPTLFNPTEKFIRKNAISYAGSYYKKYPDRVIDMDKLLASLNDLLDIDIFDRYFETTDTNYRFPIKFFKYIKGTLSFDKILQAYKGYIYGLNLNTIKYSESMFARRSLELLGSGTIVVSNYSKAFPMLFGQIILASDDPAVIKSRLTEVIGSNLLRSKLALAGVRKVMLEHTYAHRLARMMDKALDVHDYPALPSVLVLFAVSCEAEFMRVYKLLLAQIFDDWTAICIVHVDTLKSELVSSVLDPRIHIIVTANLGKSTINDLVKAAPWIAMMDPSDYYGTNYLLDLVLATRYSKASAFGKKQFYEVVDGKVSLQVSDGAYRPMTTMELRSSLISVDHFSKLSISQLYAVDAISSLEVGDGISLDYLSYCSNVFNQKAVSVEAVSFVVDDLEINQGSSIDELYAKADALRMAVPFWLGKPGWKPEKLAQIFGDRFTCDVTGSIDRFGWHIISELPDGDTCDLFSEFAVPIEELGDKSGTPFYVEAGVGLQMQLLVRFEEASGALVDAAIYELNTQNHLVPPDSCSHIRFGYRIVSSGSSRITRLVLA